MKVKCDSVVAKFDIKGKLLSSKAYAAIIAWSINEELGKWQVDQPGKILNVETDVKERDGECIIRIFYEDEDA